MIKRVYLVLLVICLCISNLLVCISAPQTSNAYQNDNDLLSQINKCKTVSGYSANTTVDEMDFVTFGSFIQNIYSDPEKIPIRWIVLEKQNDKALLLSQDVWDISRINSDWLDSDIRAKYDPNTRLQQIKSDYSYKNLDDMKLYIDYSKEFNKQKSDYVANSFLSSAFTNEEIEYITDYDMSTKINSYIYADEWTADYSQYNERMLYSNVENIIERNKVFQLSVAEYDKYLTSSVKRISKHHLGVSDDWQGDVYYESRDQYISNRGFYTEVGSPKVVYFCDTGNKYDDASQFVGTSYEQGYRPAIWVKLSNQNNEVANTNNTIIESANKNTNQNTLNDNHFDSNLSAQISNVEELPKYDSNTRIKDVGVIKFGTFYNSNIDDYSTIEWVVIEKDELNKKALLLSKDIIGSKNWTSEEQCKNKDIIWETSSIRKWLNGEFYQKYFTSDEKKSILKTHLVNNKNTQYNTNSGNETDDKVFLLSIDDIEKYFNIDNLGKENDNRLIAESGLILGKNEDRKKFAEKSTRGENWWLRTIGEKEDYVADITNTGRLRYAGFNVRGITVDGSYALGTRPAIWVSYDPNMSNSNESNFDKINSETNTDNSVLGDNIHIEGADVIQNPDGSIQIGGTLQEGAKIIQKGFDDNDIQYETQDEIDRIIADSNEATFKQPIDRVYYYAKHDVTNKTVTSINKKHSSNGLLGTGLFSNKTYYNIEIKFNEDTKKRLSKYAELEWNGSYKSGQDWVLLAGNTMNDLENVSWFGITPFKDSDRVANTKELSYYQNGKLQVHTLSANEQNRVYNKLKNAKVIVLATHNVIKDDRVVFSEEEKLGNVERFEYVKDDGSHINLVNAYIDCEEKVVEYTNDHNGYFLYVKDGFTGDLAYHEEIVAPKKKCNKFEILVFGNDSLSYSIYGNKVNFLAGKEVGGLKKFQVFGGKMDWIFELNTKDGFEDYEKYYLENKDKW